MNPITAALEHALTRRAYPSGHPRAPKPARVILRRGPYKYVRLFATRKGNSHVHCESGLEYDFCFHLEASPSVIGFVSQPATIPVEADSEIFSYTPDFVAEMADGSMVVIEVKPLAKLVADKYEPVAEVLGQIGIGFAIKTDDEIYREPRFGNVKELCRYRSEQLPADLALKIEEALLTRRPHTLGDLADILNIPPDLKVLLLLAIRDGLVPVDLDQPITLDTKIQEV